MTMSKAKNRFITYTHSHGIDYSDLTLWCKRGGASEELYIQDQPG